MVARSFTSGSKGSAAYLLPWSRRHIRGWFWLCSVMLVLASGCRREQPEWSERDLRTILSLRLERLGPPPPEPSNRVGENPRAAEFGHRLFFDPRLSGNGRLSCASCHQPERWFVDGLSRARGVREVGRNTPTVLMSAYLPWLYWDGRRESLWSQALVPLEAPDEMDSDRVSVVRLIAEDPDYRQRYEELFGPLPRVQKDTRYPASAGPFAGGERARAWARTLPVLQQRINRAFANIGKAIAAYERHLVISESRFDRFANALAKDQLDEARDILSRTEQQGLALFLHVERTQCLNCHNGPLFTNGGFHNIGTGNFDGPRLDFGRVFGLRALELDSFRCDGAFSDAEPDDCGELRFLNTSSHVPLEGAFKVPGLRNVAETAPYFHDGSQDSLQAVLHHYIEAEGKGGRSHELRAFQLDEDEVSSLVAFLRTLTSPPAADPKWLQAPRSY